MAGLIQELIENLNTTIAVYDELTNLAREKKSLIIDNDVENIKRVTQLETDIVSAAARIDKERVGIIKDVCQVLGKSEKDMTLTLLAEIISNQTEHEEYAALVDKIKASADALQEANETNKNLILGALDYIEFNINAIRSSIDSSPAGYDKSGEEYRESGGFLDING